MPRKGSVFGRLRGTQYDIPVILLFRKSPDRSKCHGIIELLSFFVGPARKEVVATNTALGIAAKPHVTVISTSKGWGYVVKSEDNK